METLTVILTFVGALLALLLALFTAKRVIKFSEGNDLMKKISASIRRGANAYLKRQYIVVSIFFGVVFVLLGVMAFAGILTPYVPFAFITGGFFSALSGFIGMKIATLSNARTANACQEGLNRGLRIAFSAGSVMGFTVVGLGLLDISPLVLPLEIRIRSFSRSDHERYDHLWYGRILDGTLCACWRRYLYQGG